jgi:hypothetical protein
VPHLGVDRDGLSLQKDVLARHPGPCDAYLHQEREDRTETVLALPSTLRVAASDQIVDAVEAVLGTGVLSFR